jgi:hypothetical protein
MKIFSQSHTIPTTTKTSDHETGDEPMYEPMKFFLLSMNMIKKYHGGTTFFLCVSGDTINNKLKPPEE